MKGNPETHTCHVCGHIWKHGANGNHNCATLLSARCAKFETALRYVAQHGKDRHISRVVQVCEMALIGQDVAQVLREEQECDRPKGGW